MKFTVFKTGAGDAVQLSDETAVIHSDQDALDLMADAVYRFGSSKIIISEKNLNPRFFDLKTGFAGSVLQKFSNYNVQLAVIGDFSKFESRSLKDFIYECNSKRRIFFLPDVSSALEKLGE
ncbi:MAG TPA: DUF4180 domain-containing protein [Leptospiraceae bacterium]|nr:DUF4180 domain-containing protein [Leptospiraceae bacterium]